MAAGEEVYYKNNLGQVIVSSGESFDSMGKDNYAFDRQIGKLLSF